MLVKAYQDLQAKMSMMSAQVAKASEIVGNNRDYLSRKAKASQPAVSVPSVTEALEYAFSGNQPTIHSPERSEQASQLELNSRGTIDDLNKAIVFKVKDLGLGDDGLINIEGVSSNDAGPMNDLGGLSFSREQPLAPNIFEGFDQDSFFRATKNPERSEASSAKSNKSYRKFLSNLASKF